MKSVFFFFLLADTKSKQEKRVKISVKPSALQLCPAWLLGVQQTMSTYLNLLFNGMCL